MRLVRGGESICQGRGDQAISFPREHDLGFEVFRFFFGHRGVGHNDDDITHGGAAGGSQGAVEAAEAVIAAHADNPAVVLRGVHAVSQALATYARLVEAAELEGRVAELEARVELAPI